MGFGEPAAATWRTLSIEKIARNVKSVAREIDLGIHASIRHLAGASVAQLFAAV
jgi:hypothetical protein